MFATSVGQNPLTAEFEQARSYFLGGGPDVIAVGLSAADGKRGVQFARAVQEAHAKYGDPWGRQRQTE